MGARFEETKWTCRCFSPYLGPFCDQQATNVPLTDSNEPVTSHELNPWQWSFFTMDVTCGAGEYRLEIIHPPGGTLFTRWSWGHLHTTLAPTTTPGVTTSSSSSTLQTGGKVTTLAVQVSETISDLRSFYVGLQWQGRNGQTTAQLRWVASEGTSCGTVTTEDQNSSTDPGQLVLWICVAVVGVAAVIGAVVILKYFRGTQKVLPHESSQRDVEQADFQTSKQQWQFES